MIKALLEKHGDVMIEDLPRDYQLLAKELHGFGIKENPDQLYISDDEDKEVKVKLFSDNEVGKHLSILFDNKDTLHSVNVLCHLISNTSEVLQTTDVENNIIHDQYLSQKDLIEDIKQAIRYDADCKRSFYFPLCGELLEEGEVEGSPVTGKYLHYFENEIHEKLEDEQSGECGNMTQYFDSDDHPTAADKIESIEWDVIAEGCELYGCVRVRLKEPFNADEEEALKEWITGQNSDGLGEGFEQRPIETDEGELYVSFWGDNYFIYNEDEFQNYLNMDESPVMGGV